MLLSLTFVLLSNLLGCKSKKRKLFCLLSTPWILGHTLSRVKRHPHNIIKLSNLGPDICSTSLKSHRMNPSCWRSEHLVARDAVLLQASHHYHHYEDRAPSRNELLPVPVLLCPTQQKAWNSYVLGSLASCNLIIEAPLENVQQTHPFKSKMIIYVLILFYQCDEIFEAEMLDYWTVWTWRARRTWAELYMNCCSDATLRGGDQSIAPSQIFWSREFWVSMWCKP